MRSYRILLTAVLSTALVCAPLAAHAATQPTDLTRPMLDGVPVCTQADRVVTIAGRAGVQPYAGFDPLTASQALLDCYGIPPEPSTATGRAWWASTYSQSVYLPVQPGDLISTTVRAQTLAPSGSNNWSGYAADIRDSGNSSPTGVGFVSTTFNVPHVSASSTTEPVSTWAGMGGDSTGDQELWQAGTICWTNTYSCYASYEDFCVNPPSPCINNGAAVLLNRTQYPVNEGDTVGPAVRWDGTYWLTDVQQNWHTTATPGIWGKGTGLTDSADWILEEAQPNGRTSPAIDATTDPVTFQNADSQGAIYQNLGSWPTLRRVTLYDCYYTNLVDALPNVPYPGDQFTDQVAQSSGHACP